MHVETIGEADIVIRWNRPRKYAAVRRLVKRLITNFDIEPVEDPPAPEAASAAQVAASAAQPAWLPGGFLALKLYNHMSNYDYETTTTNPSTAGLSIFSDMFIKQGTFGQVFAAEYKRGEGSGQGIWQVQQEEASI